MGRTVFSQRDLGDLALAVALGVAEACSAGKAVAIVAADQAVPTAVVDKLAAVFPATAVASTPAAGRVCVVGADAKPTEPVGDDILVVLAATQRMVEQGEGNIDAIHLRARASGVQPLRTVVVSTSLKGATAFRLSHERPASHESPEVTAVAQRVVERATLHYFVAEGLAKYQLLHALIAASGATKKILVRFATKEVATFYCDALLASNVQATVLCDVEGDAALNSDGDDDGAGPSGDVADVPLRGLPPSHALRSVVSQFEGARRGCVLLTAFGLTSPKADVVMDFDPPADVQTFTSAALDADHDDAKASTRIMVLDKACQSGVIALMKHYAHAIAAAAGARGHAQKKARAEAPNSQPMRVGQLRFERLPAPSAADVVVAGNKLRSLSKKLFTLANKAHDAYRSYMHYYALLRPTTVFDPYRLDLDEVASQFGLESAPLLDLRTKSNAFRPKEDYGKFAAQRDLHERRAFKRLADETIQPEVDDDADAAAEEA